MKGFKSLDKNGELLLFDIDGTVWASNKFWMIPFEGSRVAELFAWWNLTPRLGRYSVTAGRVAYTGPTTLDAKALLAPFAEPVALSLRRLNDEPVVIFAPEPSVVFDRPGGEFVVLRRRFLNLVAPKWRDDSDLVLTQDKASALGTVRAGELGVLMPIRMNH